MLTVKVCNVSAEMFNRCQLDKFYVIVYLRAEIIIENFNFLEGLKHNQEGMNGTCRMEIDTKNFKDFL